MVSAMAKPTILLVIIAGAAGVRSQEKPISRQQLPIAVRNAADLQAHGATVRGYSKEIENGQWEYEVQMVTDGHTKDVTLAPDGRVLEVEEEVPLESLPAEVRSGLQASAKPGKITKVESLTKGGTLVAYEAQVLTGSKHSEVQVGPDGKRLDHEE